MNRLITCTAVAVLLGFTPALAADNTDTPPSQAGDAANSATQPESGSADTSTGAAQQSSAPPSSDAASDNKGVGNEAMGGDDSRAAKEQSSAPEGSSAADPSKPNPTLGAQGKHDSDSSKE